MTCIVGHVDKENGKVYIGADSCAGSSSTYQTTIRKQPKVFKNKDFLIGYTSSFRMGQLLEHKFSPPPLNEKQDIMEYMCNDFIDSVISLFKSNGFGKRLDSEKFGGTFLIGFRGRLFIIEDDFQVGEIVDDYNSCGCGDEYAFGALFALEDSNKSVEEKITKALEAAEKYSGFVSGPFHIMSI